MKKKRMTLSNAAKKAQVLATRRAEKNQAPKIVTKQELMTIDNLAKPVHILVSGYQAEAVLTLVELMRESKNDATRQKSACELLALGGNSAEILKIQAIQSGRNKDISQMTNAELDAFLKDAKDRLEARRAIEAHNAEVVSGQAVPVVEGSLGGGGAIPTPLDVDNGGNGGDYGL